MQLKLIIIPSAFLLLFGLITYVRKCYVKKQSFYHRLKKKSKPKYQLINLKISGSKIDGFLYNPTSEKSLNFSLTFMAECLQIQINDAKNPRYEIEHVVQKENLHMQSVTLEYSHFKSDSYSVNVQSDFRLDIYKNDVILLQLNPNKTFIFEENEPEVGIFCEFFFPNCTSAYGLPQHAEKLKLNSAVYRLYNIDRFAYSASDNTQSLYGSVPLVYATSPEKSTGLLWLNAAETFVDLKYEKTGLTSGFYSEGGAINLLIFGAEDLKTCIKLYSQLTGVCPLPPLFSLGYHQSRYSYMSSDEILQVAEQFDGNNLPLDSIWLDIDYTDDKKYFTWNKETYKNPQKLLNTLQEKKLNLVAIIDPHIKVDQTYEIYTDSVENEYFVKNPDGSPFVAECWPGKSCWLDFLNPQARQYYSELNKEFLGSRNLFLWNDMNEPALFETEENSMDKNAIHWNGWKHRDVHNLYGFYQTMASFEAFKERKMRPFILTRSHFAGSQKYAAIWTGDNTANWEHLRISISMCLTASISGFSMCGADIGGFVKHPEDELLQRWYQLGAWLPFFRGHSNRNVPRREPYLYSTEIVARIRNSIQERYTFLPYWYSLFYNHYKNLEPVVTPLIYHYPESQENDEQFFVGNILICPILYPNVKNVSIQLPGDPQEIWYYIEGNTTVKSYKGGEVVQLEVTLDTSPRFYKGGSIIPVQTNQIKRSGDICNSPLALYVFPDCFGNADGMFYMDDLETLDYQQGLYTQSRIVFYKNNTIENKVSNKHKSCNLGEIWIFGSSDCTIMEMEKDLNEDFVVVL